MYWKAERIREALEKDSSHPAVSCEFGHAMGSSFGGQDAYIRLADEVPSYQGGFIWDYIDQAITRENRYGLKYQGYGGDFDDRPHDGNFSGDGIADSLYRAPTPKMQEVKFLYQNLQIHIADGNAEIVNRYLAAVHYTVVRASQMQMGLGGDDSWGAMPRPEFLLPVEEMTFRFRFQGIGG